MTMETRVGGVLVLSVLLVLWSGAAEAQSIPDCSSSFLTLAPCLSFVSGKGQLPSPSCCSALQPVVKNNPVCLCLLIGYGSTTVPTNFNQTLAKELPKLCQVSANEEKCPGLVGETPPPEVASGPAPPPTPGSEGPAPPPSSAPTLLSSTAVILSCTAAAFFASFL